MCEIHATRSNLTEDERQKALKELRSRKRQIELKIKALIFGGVGDGEAAGD